MKYNEFIQFIYVLFALLFFAAVQGLAGFEDGFLQSLTSDL
jgi:hypothetical protein